LPIFVTPNQNRPPKTGCLKTNPRRPETGSPAEEFAGDRIAAIKLYGERNTGTNYLRHLIRLNLQAAIVPGVEPAWIWNWFRGQNQGWLYEQAANLFFALTFSRNLGWKHTLVPSPETLSRTVPCRRGICFVTVTKNPYSWLLSLYDRPYDCIRRSADFTEFLTTPWQTRHREHAPREFPSPVALWNEKNRAYLALGARWPTLNLKYEELLAAPEASVNQIARLSGAQRRPGAFLNRDRTTKKNSSWRYAEYRDYYLQEKWRKRLTRDSISLINARLDEEVLTSYGYEKLAGPDEAASAAPSGRR